MISDEILAAQCLEGNTKAFEDLVNRYKKQVFALVYRMTSQYQEAEDITQEVFLTVYEKLYQFDINRKFGPWIYKIAYNTTISNLRKKHRTITIDFDESIYSSSEQINPNMFIDPFKHLENKELLADIENAIDNLPESYRIILVLRYQLELNNTEIAEILGIKKENVEVKVHRARKSLRNMLVKSWSERGISHELPTDR